MNKHTIHTVLSQYAGCRKDGGEYLYVTLTINVVYSSLNIFSSIHESLFQYFWDDSELNLRNFRLRTITNKHYAQLEEI